MSNGCCFVVSTVWPVAHASSVIFTLPSASYVAVLLKTAPEFVSDGSPTPPAANALVGNSVITMTIAIIMANILFFMLILPFIVEFPFGGQLRVFCVSRHLHLIAAEEILYTSLVYQFYCTLLPLN